MADKDIEQNGPINSVANDRIIDEKAIETRLAGLKVQQRQPLETEEKTGGQANNEEGLNSESQQESNLGAKKSQAIKSKTEQGKEATEEMVKQVAKKAIKKWLISAAIAIAPWVLLALLIAAVLTPVALAYYCYDKMGLVSTVTTGFSAWWSRDPAGVLVKAATNKCFKSSGGAVGANNAIDAAPAKTDTGNSAGSTGGVTGASGASH